MSRIRQIQPHFLHSRSMARVSRDAQLTYIRLWLVVDDAGRARDCYLSVAHDPSYGLPRQLYPDQRETWPLVAAWLDELEREGCIVRYIVDRSRYVRVVNWRKHQRIAHPSRSQLPAEPRTVPVGAPVAAAEDLMSRSGASHETDAQSAPEAAASNDATPIVANSGATHEVLTDTPDEATPAGPLTAFS